MTADADITNLLRRWNEGDRAAFEELVRALYQDLKRNAHRELAQERYADIQTTALVHEAYLRLVGASQPQWNGRKHFLSAAACAMRRILVEKARQRLAEKRGSGMVPQQLSEVEHELARVSAEPDLDVIELNDALAELGEEDVMAAQVVELRYFGGLSVEETAEVLDTSASSITRTWTFARAWLFRRLKPNEIGPLR